MRKIISLLALSTIISSSYAKTLTIKITNITRGIALTPLMIANHNSTSHIFEVAKSASNYSGLEEMAEGGSLTLLNTRLSPLGRVVTNPFGGLSLPGTSATTTIVTTNTHLSLVGMMLPTNDGFVGLDSWEVPSTNGTYKIELKGYDAGTELNDEMAANIPNPAFATNIVDAGGTGFFTPGVENGLIHVHSGNLGDDNNAAGKSDLDVTKHRWRNPVVMLNITVGN